jgi:4-amino-4-deoxy-L-arabinose transferase-like glycosyltransferase
MRNHLSCEVVSILRWKQAVELFEKVIVYLTGLASHPRRAALALLALCLFVYLPGVIRLPAVDRTEVIYAETTRDMVARGNWLDPRYGDVVHKFRPIGTYWAQGLAAKIAGEGHGRAIWVYRMPGLIAVTLSVLALYWLSAPLIGSGPALMASGLFAVAPLTGALAQLAITEGLALLPATIAMLCLLRIYLSEPDADARRLAALLWAAVGFGILLNALQLPILIGATLIALYAIDRDTAWLKKTHFLVGLPLALAIALPWLVVRAQQDGGVPFAGLGWGDFLDALGGSQDMKFRAWPGTFLLAAVLGFLPGTALIVPAVMTLWDDRAQKLARFLLAWIVGYFIYLEGISGKPGTYAVQVMFPAFAMAVALLIEKRVFPGSNPVAQLKWSLIPKPALAAFGTAVLFAVPYLVLQLTPPVWIAWPAGVVAALAYWSAHEGRAGNLGRWAATSMAVIAFVSVVLFALILPSIDKIWPARQIQRAMAGCPAGPISVFGFREPSSKFILKSDPAAAGPNAFRTALIEGHPHYLVSEARDTQLATLSRFQMRRPRVLGCVEAINIMRGCPVYFQVLAAGDMSTCQQAPEFECTPGFAAAAAKARQNKACD